MREQHASRWPVQPDQKTLPRIQHQIQRLGRAAMLSTGRPCARQMIATHLSFVMKRSDLRLWIRPRRLLVLSRNTFGGLSGGGQRCSSPDQLPRP